jgi:hypothetical protein
VDRNAKTLDGPLFVFTRTKCRNFENTWITDRMYLCIPIYFARDCTSNKSHSHTSIRFVTVYGLRKIGILAGLFCVYAFGCSNNALMSDLFFLGMAASSFSKVEETDGLAGSYYNPLADITVFFQARRNSDSTPRHLDFAKSGAMISRNFSLR